MVACFLEIIIILIAALSTAIAMQREAVSFHQTTGITPSLWIHPTLEEAAQINVPLAGRSIWLSRVTILTPSAMSYHRYRRALPQLWSYNNRNKRSDHGRGSISDRVMPSFPLDLDQIILSYLTDAQ
jgi:hypothetical protein